LRIIKLFIRGGSLELINSNERIIILKDLTNSLGCGKIGASALNLFNEKKLIKNLLTLDEFYAILPGWAGGYPWQAFIKEL